MRADPFSIDDRTPVSRPHEHDPAFSDIPLRLLHRKMQDEKQTRAKRLLLLSGR